jgi:hypothetical protein
VPHRYIDRRHHNEQHRCNAAHPTQFRSPFSLSFENIGISERRGLDGRGASKLYHRPRS